MSNKTLGKQTVALLEARDAEIDRLRAELAGVRARNSELAGQYVYLKADNAAKDARIAALQGGAERYWEARWRDERAHTDVALSEENDALIARAEKAEADCKRVEAVLTHETDCLEAAKAHIKELTDALREQLETKKWYTDRAEKAEAELSDVNRLFDELNDEILARGARAERAEAERDALREALEFAREVIEEGSAAQRHIDAVLAAGREG